MICLLEKKVGFDVGGEEFIYNGILEFFFQSSVRYRRDKFSRG